MLFARIGGFMDAAKSVFKLVLLNGDWYWRLDIVDEGMIGPFSSKEEADKDAQDAWNWKLGGETKRQNKQGE
jgi:hypothetical protein